MLPKLKAAVSRAKKLIRVCEDTESSHDDEIRALRAIGRVDLDRQTDEECAHTYGLRRGLRFRLAEARATRRENRYTEIRRLDAEIHEERRQRQIREGH